MGSERWQVTGGRWITIKFLHPALLGEVRHAVVDLRVSSGVSHNPGFKEVRNKRCEESREQGSGSSAGLVY